ncbi:MAG TPA: response regulator [Bacteroidia bacterium]|nr:response regulator [Bacteroidia bacterium]
MKKNKNYTLFIIEDNEAYSFMLKYKLQRNSEYKVLSFKTPEDCFANMVLNPNIIIMDYKLLKRWGKKILDTFKIYSQKLTFIILSTNEETLDFIPLMREEEFEYVIKENDSVKLSDQLRIKIENIINDKETKELLSYWGQIFFSIIFLIAAITIVCWTIY